MITGYTFAPAHCDERDVAPEITQDIQGLLGGDKGYRTYALLFIDSLW